MKFKKYLSLIVLIPLFAFSLHKYYISLCEVEYIEEQQTIQIVIGLFLDDLELTLNKNHNTKLYLDSEDEAVNIDEFYEEYLNNHLKFKINGELKPYEYIGKEYDDNIVRFYLEITDIKELNTLQINNNCLFKDFENQQNIIKIKINKFHKTYYLDNKNDNCLLKI